MVTLLTKRGEEPEKAEFSTMAMDANPTHVIISVAKYRIARLNLVRSKSTVQPPTL